MHPHDRTRAMPCAVALAALASVALPPTASAQPALGVRVAGGGCPDAALLREQLAPVLPGRPTEVSDAPAHDDEADAVSVRDLGDDYAVAMDGAERQWSDPARDCVERARVVAVFIALNVERAEQTQPAAVDDGLALGVSAFGRVAHAPEATATTAGGGVGAWLGLGELRFEVDLTLLAPANVKLEAAGDVQGEVELLRAGLDASAAYLWSAGAVAVGPFAGVGAELLRSRGAGVERPQGALRVGPGLAAGVLARLQLGVALGALLRLWVHAFPLPYDLTVEPRGKLGRTPPLWLGADLGLDWRP